MQTEAKRQVESHTVKIGNETRELPIVSMGEVAVAVFNMLGDTAVIEAAADELAKRIPEADVFVTPEAKSVPLAHALSVRTGLPYIVARKTKKLYMVGAVQKSVVSITTGKPQTLFIDGVDIPRLKGKRVIILDDVVSTGGTLRALSELLDEVGANAVATMAVFTEGDERGDVISLGHLPLFPNP